MLSQTDISLMQRELVPQSPLQNFYHLNPKDHFFGKLWIALDLMGKSATSLQTMTFETLLFRYGLTKGC